MAEAAAAPRRRFGALVCVALLAALTAGCGVPDSVVVLLANDDGSVGAVDVSNAGATRHLSAANQAAGLNGPEQAPGEAFTMKQEDVDRVFGAAIAARPTPPERFILYFELGTTRLTDASKRQLPEILKAIGRREMPDVDVTGHSDRSGSKAYNYALSLRRAEAVRDAIVGIGVPSGRISVTSHGENNPLIPTADGVVEPRNRRVEVIIR